MKKVFLLIFIATLCLFGCTQKNTTGSSDFSEPDGNVLQNEAMATTAPKVNTDMDAEEAPGLRSSKVVKIIKSNDYFMKSNVHGESISAFCVSVNGDSVAMETTADGAIYNTVQKDGITYMINHQSKLIITSGMEVASSASNMAGDAVTADGITYTKKGEGDFCGKSLYFEEYKTPSGDILLFYFDKDVFRGIKSIQGEETVVYEILELSPGHHAQMHEIPKEYQLIDIASIGG